MFACFLALELGSGARLLKSTSRRENCFELNRPPRVAPRDCESANGMFEIDGASLASLFKPGTTGMVADLIRDIALLVLGPRDILRRSRSSVRTRCKLLRCFTGTGRLVAAPGLEGALEKLVDLESLGFGGDTTTGPPSLRLMVAQRSGRRAEKL